MGWISQRIRLSDSNVPRVVVPIDPSSTGTARPETRFVCGTGLLPELRATAAAETAKTRDMIYIVRD